MNISKIILMEDLNYHAKWLLIILIKLWNTLPRGDDGFFLRCQQDLILDSGMHGSTIKRHREALISKGFIEAQISLKNGHRTMGYKILKLED